MLRTVSHSCSHLMPRVFCLLVSPWQRVSGFSTPWYFLRAFESCKWLQRFYGPIVKETLNQRPIFYPELFASISTDGEIYTRICIKVTEVKRILHHKKIFIMWLNIVRNSNWSIGREIEVWRGCKQIYYLIVSTWLTELHISFRYTSLKINHLIS